jgi:nuclear transport factor 2 (NTF2) superfamily protein
MIDVDYRAMYLKVRDELAELQQREWVGLTDEEILKSEWAIGANDVLLNFARAIEAKLREKNR